MIKIEYSKINPEYYTHPIIFCNEKVLVLTTRKIAHSQCFRIFKKNLSNADKLNYTFLIKYKDLNLSYNTNQTNIEYFNKVNEIWNRFLEKKEKRDLIIFYRNPIELFISSFMQDFTKVPPKTHFNFSIIEAFIFNFLQSLEGPPLEKSIFLEKYLNEGLTEDLFYSHNKIYTDFIKMLFEYYITNGAYENSHYSQWMSFISHLYYSDKIDKGKIKFVDIYDAPIQYALQPYFEDNIIGDIKKHEIREHNFLFNFMKKLILSDERYVNITKNILNNEALFYEKIKNNKL
jgi:hypothetical protein